MAQPTVLSALMPLLATAIGGCALDDAARPGVQAALSPQQAQRLERIEQAVQSVVLAAAPAEPTAQQAERWSRIETGVERAAVAAEAAAPLANLVWPGAGLVLTSLAGGVVAAVRAARSEGRHTGWDEHAAAGRAAS